MRNFFPMPVGDAIFMLVLLAFSLISFLPWSQANTWNGMAMRGWMMALLMVLSPTIALARLLLSHRNDARKEEHPA